ncbi:MAG: integration host factor subunit alpha [Alphaproteobacteria bacterium]|nr:integration host factor subunit alpha [Alphaproteobacteria bacterium]MDD9841919.1 integration host factor subunit alpha [Alphaproteobacteria bacterium]
MKSKTLTRADLTAAINKEIGLSRTESSAIVEAIIDEIADTLSRGEPVRLSSFGTFTIRDKKERFGRNPKTGEAARISPRRVLSFKASPVLKELVDRGNKGQ